MKTYPPDQQHSCMAAATSAQHRETGQGPGQQSALWDAFTGPREPRRGAGDSGGCHGGAAAAREADQPPGSAGLRRGLARGPGRGMERLGAFCSAGESCEGGCPAGCPRECQPTSQFPSNSQDWLHIAVVTTERCLLLQASGDTGFVLPNSPP